MSPPAGRGDDDDRRTVEDDNHGASMNADQESRGSTAEKRASPDIADGDRPAKKMKRGKYVARACAPCQKRKIKCEGGNPCNQCVQRKRECTTSDAAAQNVMSATGLAPTLGSYSVTNEELLRRLATVERRLEMVASVTMCSHAHGSPRSARKPTLGEDATTPSSLALQNVLETEGQTFAGESSIRQAFDMMEDGWQESAAAQGRLSPDTSNDLGYGATTRVIRKPRGWLQSLLDSQGVKADEAEWEAYLSNFMNQVHILYPCLHPPTIWDTFRQLWEFSALWTMTDSVEREHKRIALANVFFCLALGRCTGSSRMDDANGVHSAGWSLYSVGCSLLGNPMEISNTAAKSLAGLQALILMVLYLFRLDANQRAERILALAISNSHIAGLNRQKTFERMPAFQDQMYRRVWWAIYVLDRRMSLETGRPFLIQDTHVDTAMPANLSDTWLAQSKGRQQTSEQLSEAIRAESTNSPPTAIPWLLSMIRYSRIVGKAWEIMYGVKSSDHMPSPVLADYVESMLSRVQRDIPKELSYDPRLGFEQQFEGRAQWQIYLSTLSFMRFTFLRLLIRKPMITSSKTNDSLEDEGLEMATVCAGLATSVIQAYTQIPHSSAKYSFPLCHYLTSAVMIVLGLILERPELRKQYSETVISAVRALNVYCHNTWVSGKMMRSVSRLNVLVQANLLSKRSNRQATEKQNNTAEESSTSTLQQQGPITPSSDTMQRNSYMSSHEDTVRQTAGSPRQSQLLPHNRSTSVVDSISAHTYAPPMTDNNTIPSLPLDNLQHISPNGNPAWLETFNTDLPDWALSDFAFEQVIHGGRPCGNSGGGGGESSNANHGTRSQLSEGTPSSQQGLSSMQMPQDGSGSKGTDFFSEMEDLSFLDAGFLNEKLRGQGLTMGGMY